MISSIEARVLVHATEERERVLRALLHVIQEEARVHATIESEILEGHHGNTIELITLKISDPALAKACLRNIVSRMSELDRAELRRAIEERVDGKGELYIRLSKQAAYLGTISLDDSDDVIRIRVSYSGRRGEAIREYISIIEGTQTS